MKHLVYFLSVTALLLSCNANPASTAMAPTKNDTVIRRPGKADALTSNFIHKFEIGDPGYAQKVFDYYKNYDANTLDSSRGDFADSVVLDLADGRMIDFSRDSLISYLKKERGAYQSSIHETDAFVALKNTNDSGIWVSVWERKIDVANGKKNINLLNENWKFNDAGKMMFLRQYSRKFVEKK